MPADDQTPRADVEMTLARHIVARVIYPAPIMNVTAAAVDQLVGSYQAALAAAGQVAQAVP